MRLASPYPDFSWSHSRDRSLAKCAHSCLWRCYGSHKDDFLFVAGELIGGSVPPGRATAAHASCQAMRDLFVDLERIAGVERRRGRSFYGLRRQATDLAQDARVLNSICGHADSATREQVYRDRENERVRAHAATARSYLLEGTDGEEIAA